MLDIIEVTTQTYESSNASCNQMWEVYKLQAVDLSNNNSICSVCTILIDGVVNDNGVINVDWIRWDVD